MRESYVSFHSKTALHLNLSFIACKTDGVSRTIAITYLPYPPVIGNYPLFLGPTFQGVSAFGAYTIDGDQNFQTDSTHTGTFTITSVDTVAHLLSGTFSFTAFNVDDTTDLIEIGSGEVNGTEYPH